MPMSAAAAKIDIGRPRSSERQMSAVEDGGSDLAFSMSTRRTLRSKPVIPIVPPTIVEPVEPAMPIMKRATSIVSRLRASAQGIMKTGRAKKSSAKMLASAGDPREDGPAKMAAEARYMMFRPSSSATGASAIGPRPKAQAYLPSTHSRTRSVGQALSERRGADVHADAGGGAEPRPAHVGPHVGDTDRVARQGPADQKRIGACDDRDRPLASPRELERIAGVAFLEDDLRDDEGVRRSSACRRV
jgi:hypothetical protein